MSRPTSAGKKSQSDSTPASTCTDGSALLFTTTTTTTSPPEDLLLSSSEDSSSPDTAVKQLAELLLNAGTEYLRRIEVSLSQSLSQDEKDLIRDEAVKVDIPPDVLISAELLGDVGMFIK
jgi:hypothetical protein